MGRGLGAWSADLAAERMPVGAATDLRTLFHRLNNQLSIILANAELLEVQVSDPAQRARAAQVVASTLDAMTTARDLRAQVDQLPHGPETDPDNPPRLG
jgi:nitrogen-specific signal transduction histidine kinase